jgi:hypothetical protein
MRIGVVKEGFGHPASEADVDAKVRAGGRGLPQARRHGRRGLDPHAPVGHRDLDADRARRPDQPDDEGQRHGHRLEGLYTTSLLDYHANWRSRADELSDTLKICMFVGQYHLKHHRGHYYAKAQNLARQLKESYDKPCCLLRPAADADHADEGDAAAAAGRLAGALLPARLRDAAQHRALRRHRPSRHERPLRHDRRPARRHDAGRAALRRGHHLPRRGAFEQAGDWKRM